MTKQSGSKESPPSEEANRKPKAAASAAEDAAMVAMILQKAKAGSVDHARLLAERADFAPKGVYAAVTVADMEAVVAAMSQKASAGSKGAGRLVPKLEKAMDYVRSLVPPISRG